MNTNITLNGQTKTIAASTTIADLIKEIGAEGKRIAVECNRHIIPKSQYATTTINEHDIIEIVVAVGGG